MTGVIFTHPPDYALAALSARALRKLGIRVVLAVDAADPLPAIEGVDTIVTTTFRRNGNLNGKACVQGILATLAAAADGDDYVLKLDSDTMLLGLGWLAGHTAPAVGLFDPSVRIFYGACYALRVDRLLEYQQAAAVMPESYSCPEDIEIGKLLPGRFAYENRAPGTPFAAYSWEAEKPVDYWRKWDVLIFQRYQGRERPDLRDTMQLFL
jgi:hypothetical protein